MTDLIYAGPRGPRSRWRRLLATVAVLVLLAGMALPGMTSAQDDPNDTVDQVGLGEPPTTGGLRPGPVGFYPDIRQPGSLPVAVRIEKAGVDAPVETQRIIDGVMQNPSGPFVVAWYQETGRLGEDGNTVMAGHLDYWDVGEAVFYNVWKLVKGDKIEAMDKDGNVYEFTVDWVKNYKLADLTPETIQKEIVGPTKQPSITLITCGGPFDYQAGEYKERIIIRGTAAPAA